jgi:choline-sulfatase
VSVGKQHYALSSQAFQTEEAIVLSDLVGYTSYKGGRSHTDYDGVRFPGPTQWIMAGTFPGTIEETAEWRVVERALEILDSHDQAEPLLLRLSFNAPHTPVTPPRAYLEEIPADVPPPPAFGHREARRPRWLELLQTKYADAGLLNDEELGRMRRHYLAWCRFVDDMIARFATALEARGLLADSVFAFCADHGAHLGDHGLVQKQSFFTESVTVPYIFAAPGVAPGRIDKPVSTMTLLPTAAGLAGVTVPDEFRHLDLSRELLDRRPASEARPAEPAPASSGSQVNSAWGVDNPRTVISQSRLNPAMLEWDNRIVMVQEDNLRGVFDIDAPDDTELLYDLAVDPHELASCANNPSYAEDLERLRNLARQAAQPHSSR